MVQLNTTQHKKLIQSIEEQINYLKQLNPGLIESDLTKTIRNGRLKKVLIANRGEIAKRFFFIA